MTRRRRYWHHLVATAILPLCQALPALSGEAPQGAPSTRTRDETYVHTGFGFSFTPPSGFTLKPDGRGLTGINAAGSAGLWLEVLLTDPDIPLRVFVAPGWNKDSNVEAASIRSLTINGLPAVTAVLSTRGSTTFVKRMFVIRSGPVLYRLVFLAHPFTPGQDRQFMVSAGSFQRLAPAERVDEGALSHADPQDGQIKGTTFIQPRLGVTVSAPEGYTLVFDATKLIGATAGGDEGLIMDRAATQAMVKSPMDYFTSGVFRQLDKGSLESLTINGLEAATATATTVLPDRSARIRAFVIRHHGELYRLMFSIPTLTAEADARFRASAATFRPLPARADGQERASAPLDPPMDAAASRSGLEKPPVKTLDPKPLKDMANVVFGQIEGVDVSQLKAEGLALVLVRAQYELPDGKRFDSPGTYFLGETSGSTLKAVKIIRSGARQDIGWGIALLTAGRYASSAEPVRQHDPTGPAAKADLPRPVGPGAAAVPSDGAVEVKAGDVVYLGTMVLLAKDIFAPAEAVLVRDESAAAGQWIAGHLPSLADALKTHLAPPLEHIK